MSQLNFMFRERNAIHAARLDSSPRLQKVLAELRAGAKSTLDLQRLTGSMAIHSDIAELRANGILIGPAKYIGKTDNGRKVYLYELEAI